jgi:hypothetical protein
MSDLISHYQYSKTIFEIKLSLDQALDYQVTRRFTFGTQNDKSFLYKHTNRKMTDALYLNPK